MTLSNRLMVVVILLLEKPWRRIFEQKHSLRIHFVLECILNSDQCSFLISSPIQLWMTMNHMKLSEILEWIHAQSGSHSMCHRRRHYRQGILLLCWMQLFNELLVMLAPFSWNFLCTIQSEVIISKWMRYWDEQLVEVIHFLANSGLDTRSHLLILQWT